MIPAQLSPFANHLWQSTLFAGGAILLTATLRRNHARMRYWIWLTASVKFLIPFSLLMTIGSLLEWRGASVAAPALASVVTQINEPFAFLPVSTGTSEAPPASGFLLAVGWLLGCAAVVARWWLRWRRIRLDVRAASRLPIHAPIPVMSSPTLLEPGVFGVLNPVLLLPEGIANRLTPAQLQAILAHELCHVRRRDNLAYAIHMAVEAIFWFHPLVWWIGAQLIAERERACDEEVLRLGNAPRVYAEGILNVCKFYLESPLACASGVTGSDLKKRIEAIMTERLSHNLTLTRRLLLASAAVTAVAGPLLIGMLNAPQSRAQSKADALSFEVASIKPADPDARGVWLNFMPGGGLRATNARLRQLIEYAYEVHPFQISRGPAWMNSEGFHIVAKGSQSAEGADPSQMSQDERQLQRQQVRQRLQTLLAERFQLVIHREMKEMPVYALVVAKNGPKLRESASGGRTQQVQGRPGNFNAEGVPMQVLAAQLSRAVGRPVLDKTGLKGTYDFKLEWTPDRAMGVGKEGPKGEGVGAADLSGPSLFTALQEQLGLRLESQKGPVEQIIIDRVEKPTAN